MSSTTIVNTCTASYFCYYYAMALEKDLVQNPAYSSLIYPNYGSNQTLEISVAFVLIKLLELSTSGTISVVGGLTFIWQDPRLAWNPELYANVSTIDVPSASIWTPNVALINGVSDDLSILYSNRSVTNLRYDGLAVLVISKQFKASCAVNVKYFPFDNQNCTLTIGNLDIWTNDEQAITFVQDDLSVNLEMFFPGGEFSYVGSSIASGTMQIEQMVAFPVLNVTLIFKRNPDYYVTNVGIPSVLLLITSSLVFFVPSDNPVKITMACSLMVALYVLQQAIARLLPTTPDTPLLAIGVMIELGLGCFSVVCAVLTFTLRAVQPPLPRCLARLANAYERFRCASKAARKVQPTQITVNTGQDGEKQADIYISKSMNLVKAIKELTDLYLAQLDGVEDSRIVRSEEARQWRLFDAMLNSILFIIYITISVVCCACFVLFD